MYQLDRIKAAQNLRGFSHSKTAENLDIPLATLKKYLSGERTLPHDFWKKASQFFNVPLSYFDVKNSTSFSMSEVNFRARARIKASYSNSIAEYISLAESINSYFSRNVKNLPIFNILDDYNLDPDSDDSPEITALRIRSEWGLGIQPINNIISLLELKGIKIFSLPLNVREVDALSISLDGQPFILLDTYKSAERTRFDAAHELAHIFLHIYDIQTPNDEIDYKKRESEADRFASCFLMPDESFLQLAPKEMSIGNMIKYKSYWRVSLQAINYKAHKLNLLTDWVYRSNCMKINSLGYHKNEHQPTHHDQPILHLKLLKLLDAKGNFSINEMLNEIGISEEDFNNLTFNSLRHFKEYKNSKKPKLRLL